MKTVVRYGLLLCLLVMIGITALPASAEPEPESEAPVERVVLAEPDPEPELRHEPEDTPADPELIEAELSAEPDTVINRYRFGQDKASGDDVLRRAGNSSGVSLGKIAISLAMVIFLVLLLGWAFKKLTLRVPGSQHMKVISSIPLGQRERLLVIEIQGKQRVLGVTPQQINFLFELEESLPEEKLASEFHSQLQSWLKK